MPKNQNNGARALIEALQENGIRYVFGNFGSDHAGIIEAMAAKKVEGEHAPEVLLCPHETPALSAAHGYAQVTRKPQAVFVHVDVGTQNLGGALHNAQRGRVPVFIFAGSTPFTLRGELAGGRNREANYLQDMYDQSSIVRSYVKWDYELRTAANTKQVVARALQIANSAPSGPVYLTGAREILEQSCEVEPPTLAPALSNTGLTPDAAAVIGEELRTAERPLIITSYAGRNPDTCALLQRVCELTGAALVEHRPTYANFPANHPLHQGYSPSELLCDADFILVLDCDFPWLEVNDSPSSDAKVYALDIDPLKEQIPLWNLPIHRYFQAESYEALGQISAYLDEIGTDSLKQATSARRKTLAEKHDRQRLAWRDTKEDALTPDTVAACLSGLLEKEDIILSEAVTSNNALWRHLPRTQPGTFYSSGGSALGWGIGAALGVKLARPDRTVVALVGDGSYFFGVPSSVYWTAGRYDVAFLTIILNNRGWNATKQNVLRIHPEGAAKQQECYFSSFEPSARLAQIAEAAGNVSAGTVTSLEQLEPALKVALACVRGGRAAVVDVHITPV